MSDSLRALRSANLRTGDRFPELVDAAADAVRARIESDVQVVATSPRPRRVRLVTAVVAFAAVAVAAFLAIGTPGGEDATAAVTRAATVTAASADRSGTAVVRITHDGERWAGKTVRWNGDDLSIVDDVGRGNRPGGELRVVDGRMYGPDVDGAWVDLGPPESVDPDSGTTPAEHLAAVREDVGGATLRRITRGMTQLTTSRLTDGATVYRGAVAARLIARETGSKQGQAIRVFPFGYVAHDEAADPGAFLDAAVTVGSDGIVRRFAVTWGTWTYTVTYSELGSTPAPVKPENARSLRASR